MGSQPYFASRRQRLENARVGVERLVGDQHIAIHTGQGVVHSQQVVRFTAGRQTSRPGCRAHRQGVDLVAQSAARKPGRLIRAGFFLGAGAVLIGRHSGAVDHRIFVVGVG
jgi:hypothetical protein